MNDFISPRERARQFHTSYHGRPAGRSLSDVPPSGPPANQPFQTPDTVSANEEQGASTNTAGPLLQPPAKPKKTLKQRLQSITKKQWIIIGIVAAVLLIGGVAAALMLPSDPPAKPTAAKKNAPAPPPPPTTVASKLMGVQVDPTVNARPITAIMIENSTDARPQSGLNNAGVVFEAIAEGGITRFLTLFQENEPDYIGPVRSVRPYYVQWLMGFDAPVAHVGGSAEALQMIKTLGVKDLDQFANSGAYWRISNRAAPHNVYTSIARLREVENKKGWTASSFTSLVRKAEKPSAAPNARAVNLNISSANFNVRFDYDAATNSYKRALAGQPHIDERSGAQLSPKVVVVPVMPQGSNGKYTTYATVGSGSVYIFQDGVVTEGTWRKESNTAQFTFTGADGAAIGLNPGQTWFTIVGSKDRVSITP